MQSGLPAMKVMRYWYCLLLAGGLMLPAVLPAHTDLMVRIEMLTGQLENDPTDINALIQRGELYRRHGDFELSSADLAKARELDPADPMLDWYEGRLALDAGDYKNADQLMSRYLVSHPEHAVAWHQRAKARVGLEEYLLAADDFSKAIELSDQPGPGLYRSLALSTVAAGSEHIPAAEEAVQVALGWFPGEVSILGLATDLSLAQSDTRLAQSYMSGISKRLLELPQWRFREAVRVCLEGDPDAAVEIFTKLLKETESGAMARAGTWTMPVESVANLAKEPLPGNCAAAAWETLRLKQP